MKQLVISLASACLAILLSGCQSAKLDSHVDANYSAKEINRVVVLPMANASVSAGQANELSRAFAQALKRKNPAIQIMGASEAVEKLNQANMAGEWATFLRNFSSSGIPDTTIVAKVGKVLEVDAIIQGAILSVVQNDSDGYSYPVTRVSVRYTMIGVKNGTVLWELTGEGLKRPYAYAASPIIDAVKLAHEKIIKAIP